MPKDSLSRYPVGQSDSRSVTWRYGPVAPGDSPTVRPTDRPGPSRILSMVPDTPPPPPTPQARRALDPPERVEVVCDGERPSVVTWRGHQITVTRALGPERLSGDWWDDGYRRDYWRCESLEVMTWAAAGVRWMPPKPAALSGQEVEPSCFSCVHRISGMAVPAIIMTARL